MSDEGEKTCPLCAEEMDLTDQQLKPCRCGYEICVWCWHHIMEMAEKDESEGRCPACRTAYDKDRIVGMAANCERVVAEVSMEKKHKSQKAKTKTSENRKQLSSVRVIQRNLVYIVGLPLDLADEDLLQRKEYFGQYGKVLKVSISRTSAGTIQQFANNTCSVYITYGREDEAVRCIQSVHSFVLDGRPLRACFGTTKYCHAWLRNVPCSNPDCLYLHEVGSQEDSFTKDEIISAYTRVQQITGVSNNMQRRAGNALPPPADDFCINSSVTVKPAVKSSTNNSTNSTRCSPPTSSSGRSGALPPAASWGARASNCNSAAGSLSCLNGQTKQKAETVHGPPNVTSTVTAGSQTSASLNDAAKRHISYEEPHARQTKNKSENIDIVNQHTGGDCQFNGLDVSSAPSKAVAAKSTGQPPCSLAADTNDLKGSIPHSTTQSTDEQPCFPCEGRKGSVVADGSDHKICAGIQCTSVDNQSNDEHSDVRTNGLSLDNFLSAQSQGLQWHDSEKLTERSTSAAVLSDTLNTSREACNFRSNAQVPSVLQNLSSETEDDFDNQRLRDAIVSQVAMPASSPHNIISHLRVPIHPLADANCIGNYTLNPPIVNRIPDEGLVRNFDGLSRNSAGASVASNGILEHFASCTSVQGNLANGVHGNHLGRFDGEQANVDSQSALDVGESNIISNILSLDLDSWDDSLTSPQNLAKFLGDDKQEGNIKLSNSWKSQISNQSRFSFARQEDCRSHLFDIEPVLGNIGQTTNPSFGQEFVENRDPYLDRLGTGFGFPQRNMDTLDSLTGGRSAFQPNKLSVSRSQISAPPGFAAPSRPPPPGFISQERSDQTSDFLKSGNQLHETSFMRNAYQASPSGNISSSNDIEFIDPAILAVGNGRLSGGVDNSGLDLRSNFHVQAPGFENESRLQLLMQRSPSSHQNLRYSDVRDNLSRPNDAYGFVRHVEQSQSSNIPPFSQFSLQQPRNTIVSNGHWDGWSGIPASNDMGMADLLRNDRLGYNKLYGGYEDSKFRMTNGGDLYNRSFGM